MTTEYVIYCRRSSDESSNNQVQSIPDQIQACIEYANKEWLTIAKKPKDFSEFETQKELLKEDQEQDINSKRIYEKSSDLFIIKESKSAKKPRNRPKRTKLMKLVKSWKIQWLLSYSPDRQARNMIEWWEIIELADEKYVDLKYQSFHFNNNASWRMMLWFWFVFSKQYSDKLSEDITRWNKTTVSKWKSTWNHKYWYYRDEDTWLYKPHPKYFSLMKEAFRMKIHEQKSDKFIADRLNAKWCRREYKDWRKDTIKRKNLSRVRKDEFYYWIYISWNNIVDMRDHEMNPFFEPMISQTEHDYLNKKYEQNSAFAQAHKRKERYEQITPYSRWLVTAEDWYSLSCYIPNPKRFEKKLIETQQTKAKATLNDIVSSKQIRCKCSSKDSKFQWFEITYDIIEKEILKLFWSINISEKEYDEFVSFISNQLKTIRIQTVEKNNRINFEINKLKWEKNKYIEKHMHVKDRDHEEERIYNSKKASFDDHITLLRKQITDLDTDERETIKEFEVFVKILQKAPKFFKNATYVQKRKITDLTVSNITVTADKAVKITVLPWLEDIFYSKGTTSGGTEFLSEPKNNKYWWNQGGN